MFSQLSAASGILSTTIGQVSTIPDTGQVFTIPNTGQLFISSGVHITTTTG